MFSELVQTEENFVNILRTIVDVFKTPLETDPKMRELLNQTQMKIIFGNVPPILQVLKNCPRRESFNEVIVLIPQFSLKYSLIYHYHDFQWA